MKIHKDLLNEAINTIGDSNPYINIYDVLEELEIYPIDLYHYRELRYLLSSIDRLVNELYLLPDGISEDNIEAIKSNFHIVQENKDKLIEVFTREVVEYYTELEPRYIILEDLTVYLIELHIWLNEIESEDSYSDKDFIVKLDRTIINKDNSK